MPHIYNINLFHHRLGFSRQCMPLFLVPPIPPDFTQNPPPPQSSSMPMPEISGFVVMGELVKSSLRYLGGWWEDGPKTPTLAGKGRVNLGINHREKSPKLPTENWWVGGCHLPSTFGRCQHLDLVLGGYHPFWPEIIGRGVSDVPSSRKNCVKLWSLRSREQCHDQ